MCVCVVLGKLTQFSKSWFCGMCVYIWGVFAVSLTNELVRLPVGYVLLVIPLAGGLLGKEAMLW